MNKGHGHVVKNHAIIKLFLILIRI